MFKDNLNRILSELKKSKKISQAQIARLIGVSPSNITEWLKGRGVPNADKITKLAEVLGVQVSDLIDEPQPTENTNISNSTFNNSVAINKGSITINGYSKESKDYFDYKYRSEMMRFSPDEIELAVRFIDFIRSSGYELKKK